MSLSALIIGHGSIGQRHAKILNEIREISHVFVLSSQNGLSYNTIKSLEEIPSLNPKYVVIASPTSMHYSHLKFLEEHLDGCKILVEKPIFDKRKKLTIRKNDVYVGYNLRFHPMLIKIKEAISGRKLWNIQIFCGSYLPDWRPGRDYRETSSAGEESGGGVLLDLSHELDYVQWLIGPLIVKHSVSEKISDLEIDSDDLLLLSSKTETGANVHISLNYFTRKPMRQILIDGERISIQADLITHQLSVKKDNEQLEFSWPHLDRNDTYKALHLAILQGNLKKLCSFEEGLNTMRLIEDIKSWSN
jgi:predicted dehydrogenase